MASANRRRFLKVSGAATSLALGVPGLGLAQRAGSDVVAPDTDDRVVQASGDGLALSATQYARLLERLAHDTGIAADSYAIGGVIDRLETEMAALLGKERAVFMPTGTMANHLAVRALANGPSRVVVQEASHFYLDEGDCAQTLSGLTLLPLAPGRATFAASDVETLIERTRTGRVANRISVIAIETPVRRRQGEMFDPAEMQKVIALAKREGIKLHLDGARLFLQASYTGESVAETAKPFDTVYVSLYKYFNAASGAILAGPRALLDDMFHTRRMFGGGLASAWPFAAVALHYLPGFATRFDQARQASEAVIAGLTKHGGFGIERVTPGTNLFRLRVRGDSAVFRRRLAEAGVHLAAPQQGVFVVGVNETWNRRSADEVTNAFVRALG